ncbi:MAG: helix-turn-helix transcriptional regulator [Chloroflexota bacterium]|nr:helix-turn-helix transcriptional regulator [Chloroflexota bacterium]
MPRHRMPGSGLADKVNYLVSRIHPPGREYTHVEIAAGIAEKTGISVTPEYIGQLRAGKITNPSMRTLSALARFFGVPVGTFFDEEVAERVYEEVELAAALRDAAARDLALRLPRLTPDELRDVTALVDQYLEEEDKEQPSDDDRQDPQENP